MSRSVGLLLAGLFATPLAQAEGTSGRAFAQRADGIWLRPMQDHVALSRDLPGPELGPGDSEAVRLVFSGYDSEPPQIRVSTRRASGVLIDTLSEPKLTKAACPPDVAASASCFATAPLRLTPDRLDRDYALARERSLEAELGGQLLVEVAGQPLASFSVGAPHSAAFAGIERLSVKLRLRVLRVTSG